MSRSWRNPLQECRAQVAWLTALAWVGLPGCAPDEQPQKETRPPLLKQHQFLSTPPPAIKALGEDCSTYGKRECGATGVCFHNSPRPSAWTCTIACQGDAECPAAVGWRCASISMTRPEERYCTPPSDWVPRAVSPRTDKGHAP